MKMTTGRRWGAMLTASLVVMGGLLAGAPAHAVEVGPDPTQESIEAVRGPFEVSEQNVPDLYARGFGGGTIYYPEAPAGQTFGAVAVSPGYTASQSTMAWLGPRIASQGFVVFTIDTNSRYDQPGQRGDQLLAALEHLTDRSSVAPVVDPERLAVLGHSMGGGGSIEAAKEAPSLKAVVALTPWNAIKRSPGVSTPTLIIGAQYDTVATTRSHAVPLYEGLPDATPRAYLELRGASHFAPNISNTAIAAQSIAWLKRFVDDDLRYDQFLCPGPQTGLEFSDARTSCPF